MIEPGCLCLITSGKYLGRSVDALQYAYRGEMVQTTDGKIVKAAVNGWYCIGNNHEGIHPEHQLLRIDGEIDEKGSLTDIVGFQRNSL